MSVKTPLIWRPLNEVKKSTAPRKECADWEKYEAAIRDLCAAQTPRGEIVERLKRDYEFEITVAQLDRKLKAFGLSGTPPSSSSSSTTASPASSQTSARTPFSSVLGSLDDSYAHDQCFRALCDKLELTELASTIPVISDFLRVSRLFKEAFELNYWLLNHLVNSNMLGEEAFVAAVIACLKTATTPIQQQLMSNVADVILSSFTYHPDVSSWFVITIKLYQGGLSPWLSSPSEAHLPLCMVLRSRGRFWVDEESLTKRRECIEIATRARESLSQTGEVLREGGDVSEYWTSPFIAALADKLYESQRASRIGERLLVWLLQLLKHDPRRLEIAARGRAASAIKDKTWFPTAEAGDEALADDLFLFLLGEWSRRPPQSLASCSSRTKSSQISICLADEAQHFDLFYLLATFSSLIMNDDRKRRGLSPRNILSILGVLQANGSSFNLSFVEAYRSRVSLRAAEVGVAQNRVRHEGWTQILLDYASNFLSNDVKNADICDINSEVNGSLAFNDPILGQWESLSSSARSHLSSIHSSRGSLASRDKRTSKTSSTRRSWNLSSYLPTSEHGSSRASMMLIDE